MKYNVAGFKEGYAMPFALEEAESNGSDLASLQMVREIEQRGNLVENHDIQLDSKGTTFFLYKNGFIAVSKKDWKKDA